VSHTDHFFSRSTTKCSFTALLLRLLHLLVAVGVRVAVQFAVGVRVAFLLFVGINRLANAKPKNVNSKIFRKYKHIVTDNLLIASLFPHLSPNTHIGGAILILDSASLKYAKT